MPGFAKIVGDANLAVLGYVFVMISIGATCQKNKHPKLAAGVPGLIVLFCLVYGLILGVLMSFAGEANGDTVVIGIATFLFPLLLAAFVSEFSLLNIFSHLPNIAVIHGIIAIVVYPVGPIAPLLGDVPKLLTEGVMAFRLASVSGSLAFSALVTTGFAIHIFNARFTRASLIDISKAVFLMACVILSMQRVMWICLFFIFACYIWQVRRAYINALKIGLVFLCFATFALGQIAEVSENLSDMVLNRVFSIYSTGDDSAVGERTDQWYGVIKNISAAPLGAGPGQIGQSSREGVFKSDLQAIPDGDYFRIISEYGLAGMVFVGWILYLLCRAIDQIFLKRVGQKGVVLPFLVVICALQSIGSSATELYFINFIYFCVLLHFHAQFRTRSFAK